MNKQVMPLSAEVIYSQVIKRFNTGTYGAFSSSMEVLIEKTSDSKYNLFAKYFLWA